ncbi:MAG TPA: DUF3800 domain-containing protein [Sphingomonas sp.]
MLRAYVDDSISNTGDRTLVLAALIHNEESWAAFVRDWQRTLAEPPAIAYLKMAEANNRRDQFRHFSEKERDRKLHALADVIRHHAPWGFHASVSTTLYRQLVEPTAPFPMRTPYFFLLYAIVFGIARTHADLRVDDPCDFIFDNYSGLDRKALPVQDAMIESAGASWTDQIGASIRFADDKVEVPLQAADLLAWLIRRDGEAPLAPPYEALLDKIVIPGVHRAQVIGRDVLERIGQGFADIPLASGIDKKSWKDLAALFESGVAKQVNDAVRRAGLYPPT